MNLTKTPMERDLTTLDDENEQDGRLMHAEENNGVKNVYKTIESDIISDHSSSTEIDCIDEVEDNKSSTCVISLSETHTINIFFLFWLIACLTICVGIFFWKNHMLLHDIDSNCDFSRSYFSLKDVKYNITYLRKNEPLFSSSFDGVFSIIRKYVEKVEQHRCVYPVVISLLSGQNNLDRSIDESIRVIHTFSKTFEIVDGSTFSFENDIFAFDKLISQILSIKSVPIVIYNVGRIHPNVARTLFKFCDGLESYCKSAFFLFIFHDDTKLLTKPKSFLETEAIIADYLKTEWKDYIPQHILVPLVTRITEFTLYI